MFSFFTFNLYIGAIAQQNRIKEEIKRYIYKGGQYDREAAIRLKNNPNLLGKEAGQYFKRNPQQFSNFFNAYAKAVNKHYRRTGSLFQKPFKRKRIESQEQLTQTLLYIHYNPVDHGFVRDPIEWPFSSYPAFLSSKKSFIIKAEVVSWFQSKMIFRRIHDAYGKDTGLDLEESE